MERPRCFEFLQAFPDGSGGWSLERARSFDARCTFYLFTKPPGPWALRETANGTFEWMPARVKIGQTMR